MKRVLILLGWLLCLVISIQVGYHIYISINPYPDCHFLADYRGATGRMVFFKPVLASDHNIQIGPEMGAENGRLVFYDWDSDGKRDVVVETEITWGPEFGDYRSIARHVLKYFKDESTGRPGLERIHYELTAVPYP